MRLLEFGVNWPYSWSPPDEPAVRMTCEVEEDGVVTMTSFFTMVKVLPPLVATTRRWPPEEDEDGVTITGVGRPWLCGVEVRWEAGSVLTMVVVALSRICCTELGHAVGPVGVDGGVVAATLA